MPGVTQRLTTCLALAALSFASCGRRPAPRITSISDELPPTEGPHHAAFAAVAQSISPAVVVLATFDERGRLVATEHAFFISGNGDLLAERSAMNNAVSAVVKSADGRAYDIFGSYLRSAVPNFILLKTNARDVPHLDSPPPASVADGAPAAIVLGSAGDPRAALLEGQIAGRKKDDTGEWLTFEPSPPATALGAPAINESGAIIGIVAQHDPASAPAVFRSPRTRNLLVAQTEEVFPPENSPPPEESSPPPPAEGPPATRASPHPSSSPAKSFNRGGKLIYTPAPQYPVTLAWFHFDLRASGSYQLAFDASGHVTDVQVAHSSGHPLMDKAAVETLRKWRSEPGEAWSMVVPIRFKP